MHQLPHHYAVKASAGSDTPVRLTAEGLAPIESAAPVEFDGPGDLWSPESLLVAAVADCFILSFRAIARASRLNWSDLSCGVEGLLDKTESGLRFTNFAISAVLTIPSPDDSDRAEKLLHKAEHACLITNSLTAKSELLATVTVS
ncbi:MAG: OsmC family protein [Proteobacteria bacterium]|nr:OsmC family protein [Pseudomonadota bacterium]